ncbi:oligosaccharide flippase family protein [Candidatus Parcubacteria bacterium]|nr:oligosaccharide flippase family protein [Candidatus Parcubacteria bacterium]
MHYELKKKGYSFLRRSEKYLKTDMIYVARGGFWIFSGQMITALAGFFFTLVLANLLDKDNLGTFRFVLSLAGILAIPTLAGIDTAILQAVARGKEKSFLDGLKTKLKYGALSSLACLGVAGYYFFKHNSLLALCFLAIALFVPLINSFPIYESFWAGRKKFETQTKYRALVSAGATILIVLVILITKNLVVILLAYFSAWSLLHGLALYRTIKTAKANQEIDKESIKYGKHLSLLGILGQVNSQLDKIVFWHFLGPEKLAVYFIALALPQRIETLMNVVSGLTFPKFSQNSIETIKKGVKYKMLIVFLLVLPVVLLYILLAPFFYKLFFPKYPEAILYSQLYILVLLAFPRTFLGIALKAKMQTKKLYLNSVILTPIYFLLLFILLPTLGILGAVLALLALEAITFLVEYLLFKRMR